MAVVSRSPPRSGRSRHCVPRLASYLNPAGPRSLEFPAPTTRRWENFLRFLGSRGFPPNLGSEAAAGQAPIKPKNTPPHRDPQETLGKGGVCLLPDQICRRYAHNDPHNLDRHLLHRPPTRGASKNQKGHHRPRHGPQRSHPRLRPLQVATCLLRGLGTVLPLRHY